MERPAMCLGALVLLVALATVQARRTFEVGGSVPTYMSTVGPYHNPSQTYKYHHLPFCRPESKKVKKQTLGETLDGLRKTESRFVLPFRSNLDHELACERDLTPADAKVLIDAIEEDYYFTMYYDDLPVGNFIGLKEHTGVDAHGNLQAAHYLPKHFYFSILYNGPHVVFANVSIDASELLVLEDITETQSVRFTYSARWTETDVLPENRAKFYSDVYWEEENDIRWLSIVNSAVLASVLVITVLFMMHRIRSVDRTVEDEEEGDVDENGWKLVHGDVFRFPPRISWLCALCGSGVQLVVLSLTTVVLSSVGFIHTDITGSLYTSIIALYAVTCALAGGISGSLYKQLNGRKWAWNLILAYFTLSVPVCAVAFVANLVAAYHRSTAAIPFPAMLSVFLILVIVGFPMTVMGGIAGRRMVSKYEAPVRTKLVPREIPAVPWHRGLVFSMLAGGFLPFSAIYLELFYIYESAWGHVMYSWHLLPFAAALVFIMTSASAMILTFFQLNNEDYRWWWQSFLVGGAPSIFIFLYSWWFYHFQTRMEGVLQFVMYFSSVIMVCYCAFLLLGSVGFYSSQWFVRFLYKNHKCD